MGYVYEYLNNCETGHRLVKQFEEKGQPAHIWKYMSISNYTKESLEQNYFYYGKPSLLNDPFDCHFGLINVKAKKTEYQDYFKKFVIPNSGYSEIEFKEFLNDYKKMENAFTYSIKNQIEKVGICCFSRNGNNILMWSHYANSHSGICLKFNSSLLEIKYCDVFYTNEFNQKSYIKSNIDSILNMVFTKYRCWEYEQELRSVKPRIKYVIERKVNFNPELLEEIVFGLNTKDEDIKEIIRITKYKYPNIRFSKAYIKPKAFELEYKPLLI